MTLSEPQHSDSLVSPLPSSHRLSYVISWTVILLCVGVVVIGVNVRSRARGGADAVSPKANTELWVAARIAVAMKTMFPQQQEKAGNVQQTLSQLDAAAKTTEDKFRVAIVAAELAGADPALARLERLGDPVDFPDREILSVLHSIYTDGVDAVSQEDRQTLVDRLGWYGKLALAHGKPDSEPQRTAAIDPAKRAFVGLMVVGVMFLLLGVAGLVLLVLAIIFLFTGTVRRRFMPVVPVTRAGASPPVFLESFALYLVLFLGFGLAIGLLTKDLPMIWHALGAAVLPVAIWWPVWRGASWRDTIAGFGWRLDGQNVFLEMLMGAVGYIAGIPLLVAAFFLSAKLSKLAGVSPTHPIIEQYSAGGWRVAQIYFIAAVFAPVMEETMFRGALFNHLRGRWGWTLSAVVTGVLFAAIHPQGWTFVPVLATIGIVLARIREWRGSIWASMTGHALNNAVIVTLGVMLLGGKT